MNEGFTPKNVPDEEWSMTNPNKNLPPNQTLVEPIEDWSMTGKLVPPQQDSNNGWKMPEPKFRATSGSLPEDFVKKTPDIADLDTQPLTLDKIPNNHPIEPPVSQPLTPAAESEQPAPINPIEPQPDVAEVFLHAEMPTPAPPEEKQRSQAMQLFLAALGLAAMLFFAVAFLVIIYFLFFYKAVTE
jgi:hypothetical protein